MDREKVDRWCENGILGLVLAILVAGPLLFGGTGEPAVFGGATNGWHFLPLQGLTICVMILWGVRFWVGRRVQILWPPICWAVTAFAGYAILRYFQADVEYPARQEVIQILVYAFVFFAVLNNLHRQEPTRVVGLTLVFLGMAISVYAIAQVLLRYPRVWNVPSPYPGRGTGTFINPNSLAGFLEMILPMGFCYLLAGRLSHVTKVFLGYAALVIMAGIAVTVSRGGLLASGVVLVALCVALLFQRYYRVKALLLIGLLGAIGYFAAPKMSAIQFRFGNIVMGSLANDSRRFIWSSARQIWEDNFLLGVGPGLFDSRFREYRPTELQMRPLLVHNDYLNALVDYGVVGAALITTAWVLLAIGIAGSWRFVRGGEDDFSRKKSSKFAFLLGASFGLAAILIHSAIDFNLHIPANAILAVTLMALLSSQWRFATERYWFTAGLNARRAATVLIFTGVTILGLNGFQAARQHYWLGRAEKAPLFSWAQIAALTNAAAADPKNFDTTYTIGECYRTKSFEGPADYASLARQAMAWYKKGMLINPHEGYNWARYGQCIDWIATDPGPGKEDSATYFKRANELDPNGQFTTLLTARHFVDLGDYAAARSWFERSLELESKSNETAVNYLQVVDQRMREAAGTP